MRWPAAPSNFAPNGRWEDSVAVYLDVPYCNQLSVPEACSVFNDPTGCWYCSACMIGWYFEAGPRQGVPELHTSRLSAEIQGRAGFTGHVATGSADAAQMMQAFGGGQSEHVLLAKREHLTPLPHCAEARYAYSNAELERLLRRYGPIFFYWQKTRDGQTYGHASVLVGVRQASPDLIFHDPENAPRSSMDLSEWNAKRQRWKYSQMRRAGVAHQIRQAPA